MSDEVPPPWFAIPELRPFDSVNQGLPEVFMHVWVPFWRALTPEAKAEYLDRWDASEEWRASIEWRFNITDEELEEDWREWQEMEEKRKLAEQEKALQKPPGLFRRIGSFFRKRPL